MRLSFRNRLPYIALFSILCLTNPLCEIPASAQISSTDRLRVANWNVTNYNLTASNTSAAANARRAAFQTAIYTQFNGRSLAPDVLLGQEFTSAAAVTDFLGVLNSAPGSPGDWLAAPFVNGPDTDSALFYRSSKATLLNTVVAYTTTGSPDQPRNTMRYDLQILNDVSNPVISMYNTHMKSGDTGALDNPAAGTDRQRRLLEAQHIMNDVATLPADRYYLVGGDFNTQSSQEDAFQKLNGDVFNTGAFRDPINTPGSWNNNSAFRFVNTQAPGTQMDDRLDFLLLSSGLVDGSGIDYLGNPLATYSTTTWDDPNHSYRAWGNDGSTFDQPIKVGTNASNENQMVGRVVAQALIDTLGGDTTGGHLPILLDLHLITTAAATPEPGGLWLFSIGLLFLFPRRKREESARTGVN